MSVQIAKFSEEMEGEEEFVDELKPGTELLRGQYVVEDFLAAGGFGITYTARDSLNRPVVVKECFPSSFCHRTGNAVQPRSRAHIDEFRKIVRLFTQEAKSLAKVGHPNIVGVHHVFEENNTAYMAMDLVQGRDLLEIISTNEITLKPAQIVGYLEKMLDAIGFVHTNDILHRDISPDNILIRNDGQPVLIDFGAAREQVSETNKALSALRVVKDGYSPQEFYISGSEQTPAADLYSLAACFYHIITGTLPANSQVRLAAIAAGEADPYVSLADRVTEYSEAFCAALDKAMSVLPKERMQSAAEWRDMMDGRVSTPTTLEDSRTALPPLTKASNERPAKKGVALPVLAGTTALFAVVIGITAMSGDSTAETRFALGETAPQVTAQPVTPSPVSAAPASDFAIAGLPLFDAEIERIESTSLPGAFKGFVARPTFTPLVTTVDRDTPLSPTVALPPVQLEDAGPIRQRRMVVLPFATDEAVPGVVGEVTGPAPVWLTEGIRIVSVDGKPVGSLAELRLIANAKADKAGDADIELTLGIDSEGLKSDHKITLPLAHDLELSNKLTFRTRNVDGTWETSVAAVPEGLSTFEIGDRLVAHMSSSTLIDGPETLRALLEAEAAEGRSDFTFAIEREGQIWVESFSFPQAAL